MGSFNNPLIFLIDIILLVSIASIASWYFYYYLKKDFFGKFLGGAMAAMAGSVILLLLQKPIRYMIMWLMSPKWGDSQLSRVNLIVASIGALLSLYIFNKINKNKERT